MPLCGSPNLSMIIGVLGGHSRIHSDSALVLICSGFIWGEYLQDYLTRVLVPVSEYTEFYVNCDVEACVYRFCTN